jgi:hypothetical protein
MTLRTHLSYVKIRGEYLSFSFLFGNRVLVILSQIENFLINSLIYQDSTKVGSSQCVPRDSFLRHANISKTDIFINLNLIKLIFRVFLEECDPHTLFSH